MLLALLTFVSTVHAQACACSRTTVLPNGSVSRPGELILALEYDLSIAGDTDLYRGFYLKDLHGDSMAGMFMPPHLIQSATLTTTVGLPKNFSAFLDLPYIYVHHLSPSGMPGDVDARSFGDVDAQLAWGRMYKKKYYTGFSVGPTFPTGEVVEDSPVRLGRGVFGVTGRAQGTDILGPRTSFGASLGFTDGLGADASGYRLGANAQGAAGLRFSPRENGPLLLSAFTIFRWQGKDQEDALGYENTGYFSHDLALGATRRLWSSKQRSASLTLRGVAPLWQIVGDPMYAENFALALGLDVVAR
jgi:hypothetical protein